MSAALSGTETDPKGARAAVVGGTLAPEIVSATHSCRAADRRPLLEPEGPDDEQPGGIEGDPSEALLLRVDGAPADAILASPGSQSFAAPRDFASVRGFKQGDGQATEFPMPALNFHRPGPPARAGRLPAPALCRGTAEQLLQPISRGRLAAPSSKRSPRNGSQDRRPHSTH